MRSKLRFLGLGLVCSLAAAGCNADADLSGTLDVTLGQAHATSAATDEASKALAPAGSLTVLGYQVSKTFHDDGLVRVTLVPQDESGGAILDDKIFIEIDATCNVPFPMNAEVKVGDIRRPVTNKPFKFGIALDGSGSMDSSDHDKLRVKAVQNFIQSVGTSFPGSMFRSDQFETKTTMLADFTSDLTVAEAAITKASAEGGTALHKSTAELIDGMAKLPDEKYQPALLVLSDGMDNASEGVTSEQVIAKANAAHIPIYAVGLGGALDVPGLSFVGDLQSYADGTGGVFTYLKDANSLVPMFDKLALGTQKGQLFADVKIKGGVFVPFSTITIKIAIHSGSKVVSDSIDFIVPIN